MAPLHEIAHLGHAELLTPGQGAGLGAEDHRILPHARHAARGMMTASQRSLTDPEAAPPVIRSIR